MRRFCPWTTALLSLALFLSAGRAARATPPATFSLAPYCADSIRNGGFETGTFLYWTTSGGPSVNSSGGHTGWHSALLGGRDGAHDTVRQEFACPYVGAQMRFTTWVYVHTAEAGGTEFDNMTWTVADSKGNTYINALTNTSAADAWLKAVFVLADPVGCAPGVTWSVNYDARTDASNPTWFYVDDVSFEVCCEDDVTEPNNSFDTAVHQPFDPYPVLICPNGDEDWFKFPAYVGQRIVVDLTNLPANYDVNLFRSEGQMLCSNQTGTTSEHCEVIADITASWRVRVRGVGGATSSSPALLWIETRNEPTPTTSPTPIHSGTPTGTRTQTPTSTGPAQPTATRTRTPTLPPGGLRRLFLPVLKKSFVTPHCSDLLTNGGFEDGGLHSWSSLGDVTLGAGRGGPYGAQLAGRDNAAGELWQWVTIPAGAKPVLWELWWKAESSSAQSNDLLLVRLETGSEEQVLLTLRATAPLNVWRREVVDLAGWAGRDVLVGLLVRTDGSVPTTFRVDDMTLLACGVP